jgi:2-phosphoglycerate kinase
MNKIVCIGGVAGTGKTSLAKVLSYKYGFYHRMGTGFIREIVKTAIKDPCLDCHTYLVTCEQAYQHLKRQTLAMKDAINACINRAHREGTSLIMEGNHLIPWELENSNITHSIILEVTNSDIHWRILNGKSHKKRVISEDDFKRIREMQETLIFLAEKNNIPVVKADDGFKNVIEEVEKFIK